MIKRFFCVLFLLSLFSILVSAQKPRPKPPVTKKPAASQPKIAPLDEKEELNKALAETDLTKKIAALQKFAADFPNSAERTRALEIAVSLRAQMADEKLQAGDASAGIELFKRAVAEAPTPMSDKLFTEIVLQFPTNLFYRGQQTAAIEVARLIEEKTADNAKQLLGIATFYLGTENADAAIKLAEKAIEIDPDLPAAYQTLGLANRLAFRLDDAAAAYARALELDPESIVSKRSLAEMKRATGKTDEAITLYRELLEKNPEDLSAQTGLTLSLFNAGRQAEAETELAKSLEVNSIDLPLLVGAAYWYAANRQGDKALEYAQKAVTLEPRYTWARIAMARALLVQGNPLAAEKELIAARQFGDFPTLNYEIASARLAAGLYEEAAQELSKNFAVKNDVLEVRLGNRVAKQAESFIELIELERRASIFEPLAADDPETAEKLKTLLRLNQTLAEAEATDGEVEQVVNEFVKGSDKARIHRELYAANRLLQTKKNLPKALELTQAAIRGVDSALDVPNAAAAVMAEELYESRTIAMSRGEVVIVPQIPRQTLLAILRGRIEEISGWTLYQQNKPQEAVVRLKRAVGILPEKSAWWRSSTWKLGAALEAAGKHSEALDMYIKNYQNSEPSAVKYSIIETLYQRVKGNLDGLDRQIGVRPISPGEIASRPNETTPETVAQNTEITKTEPEEVPATVETTTPIEPTPEASPEISPEATPEVSVKPETKETPSVEPEPTPTAEATPETTETPAVKPEETPTASPSPKSSPENTEIKTTEIKETPASKPTPKPLFDPVIITVPPPETPKTRKPDPAKTEEQNTENPSSQTSETLKSDAPPDNSGTTRPRLFPLNPTAKTAGTNADSCELTISQESVSILNNGGNLGILLGFRGEGDVSKITPVSGSPDDIEITLEPEIGRQSNRAFFVIKSISANKGVFTVTFDSPCGKKEVLVKVR
jgi:tetratricopeptide (TPR) repeat protein